MATLKQNYNESAEEEYLEELNKYKTFLDQKNNLTRYYQDLEFKARKEALKELYTEEQKHAEEAHEKELKRAKLEAKIANASSPEVKAKAKQELDDLDKYYNLKKKYEDKFQKDKKKTELELLEEEYNKKKQQAIEESSKTLFSKDANGKERLKAFQELKEATDSTGELAGAIIHGLASLAKALDNQIDKIAGHKLPVDTRLYGLQGSTNWAGSHWEYYSNKITGVAGISPYVKQEAIVNKLLEYINKGIAYNVDQRAFLGTISEEIATTFDAANSTLLEIVRIQQSDSTAARLGMEASLNAYLNSMYQSTEYLSDISKNVTSQIYQATSLMGSTDSIGFEYQVQKWLGSLYSVGMSQNAIQGIAGALGALGSGNVSSLAGNNFGNLLVMAASRAGLSYSDLLIKGLNESDTNKLMKSMVEYLAEIANSNKVVQSQYASIFGLATADIKAAENLRGSLGNISRSNLSYGGAMNNLYNMADSMWQRNSLGGMLSNAWQNVQYSMSAGIANNPALYGLWKAASLLEDTVGGIAIPFISAMGFGIDLETTVADLMRVGALSGGILSSIGAMISAGSGGGLSGSGMLEAMGLNKGAISMLTRGTGSSVTRSGSSTSQSTFVGNSSGSDVYDSTMAGAEDTRKTSMAQVEEDAKDDNTVMTWTKLNGRLTSLETILQSLQTLFEDVKSGNAVRVAVENYGLTGQLGSNSL